MYQNNAVAATLIIEPKLLTKLQPANAPGQSLILLGLPYKPKKC